MIKAKMGSVSITREGDAAHFECECGAKETVANYENGERPKRFEFQMNFNSEYSRCSSCRREHKGELGRKYN